MPRDTRRRRPARPMPARPPGRSSSRGAVYRRRRGVRRATCRVGGARCEVRRAGCGVRCEVRGACGGGPGPRRAVRGCRPVDPGKRPAFAALVIRPARLRRGLAIARDRSGASVGGRTCAVGGVPGAAAALGCLSPAQRVAVEQARVAQAGHRDSEHGATPRSFPRRPRGSPGARSASARAGAESPGRGATGHPAAGAACEMRRAGCGVSISK